MSEQKSQLIYFVSDYAGYSISNNSSKQEPLILDGEEIGSGKTVVQFNPFKTFDEKKQEMTTKGWTSLHSEKNKEKIAWLEKYPDYGRGFVKANTLPLNFHDGSIITGAGGNMPGVNFKAIKKNAFDMGNRYAELKAKLYTPGGQLRSNIDDGELAEYEAILEEINKL